MMYGRSETVNEVLNKAQGGNNNVMQIGSKNSVCITKDGRVTNDP